MNTLRHPRQDIYYWKCDRPSAFYGLQEESGASVPADLERQLAAALADYFGGGAVELRPGGGQGNHLTFRTTMGGREAFVRVEAGPEGDDYMEIEAHLLREVARLGVPAPAVLGVDATRRHVPFAWQVLDYVPQPDLNRHYKQGCLDMPVVMFEIGACMARWQTIVPSGYGPFDVKALREENRLRGYHDSYTDYFHTRLDAHLAFLTERGFLPAAEASRIRRELERHTALLTLNGACLVHKDLALWNILGSPGRIVAFIDWDDAVGGDPMDDVSLLGCFHDGRALGRVLEGYCSVRPLPAGHRRRFWLHLLRNMLFKAVIRVGAGYFDRSDSFFLIDPGGSGTDLRTFTFNRIQAALHGLTHDLNPTDL